jgi:hypothetical protein
MARLVRQCPRAPVRDVTAVRDWCVDLRIRHLLVDVEGTVVPHRAPDSLWRAAVGEVASLLDGVPDLRVTFVTNSKRQVNFNASRLSLVSGARKPFSARKRLDMREGEPLAVWGDQVLTDGLLAWRLRGAFLEAPRPVGEPAWPRFLRRAAQVLLVGRLFWSSSTHEGKGQRDDLP